MRYLFCDTRLTKENGVLVHRQLKNNLHEFEKSISQKQSHFYYLISTEDNNAHYLFYCLGKDAFDFLLNAADTANINSINVLKALMPATTIAYNNAKLGKFSQGALIRITDPNTHEPNWCIATKLYNINFGEKIKGLHKKKKIANTRKNTLKIIAHHASKLEDVASRIWHEYKNTDITNEIYCNRFTPDVILALFEKSTELYKFTKNQIVFH